MSITGPVNAPPPASIVVEPIAAPSPASLPASSQPALRERSSRRISSRWAPLILTPAVLLLHGYHPFAGDAGIYVAGVRHILDSTLYPRNAAFVTAFTHRSLFAWVIAVFIRLTHIPLSLTLLLVHLLSVALFLFACRQTAAHLFTRESSRWCAVLLAAACFTLPVAGTALVLMDPYVTARSFSTPLSLLAVSAALDPVGLQRRLRTVFFLGLAAAVHPLMACYACAFVLLQSLIAARHFRTAISVCAGTVAACGIVFALAHRMPVDSAYRQAILLPPRSFLFLARWHWYEDLGLVLPLLLFAIAVRQLPPYDPRRILCLASLLLGIAAILIAALFVPPGGPYPLVPFQVLRSLHLVYAIGLILAAAPLPSFLSRFRPAAFLFFPLLFAAMFLAEPLFWPGCSRIEWPGAQPVHPYQQAFVWIRDHTPSSAVFAFNPGLVYLPNEDEQGFRAIAERDQLADDKDAGVAAVVPSLASRWAAQRNPALLVDSMSDAQRRSILIPLGATWLLLAAHATTGLPCPWRNSVVQVCRLTP